MKITFLGTGTSHGIPMISCTCPVCRSTFKKNKRLRPSVLIDFKSGRRLLIDTSPDLRQQSLMHGLMGVDAVLFTHDHNDHINGLDDLRGFSETNKKTVPCFGTARTIASVKRRFAYALKPPVKGLTVPKVSFHAVNAPFRLLGRKIVPLPVMHGAMRIFGYRIGSFAYVTDCKTIPEKTFGLLEGVDTLVIDALRYRPHPTHMCLEDTLEAVARIAPRRTLLTHICHDMDHRDLCRILPAGIRPAHDGLEIEVRD